MTYDEVMAAFDDRVAAGEKAVADGEYRQAASIFSDLSGAYAELARKNPDEPDLFFAGMAHYYGAKTFRTAYSADEQEKVSPSELIKVASNVVEFSRKGIQAFKGCGNANGVELCYGLLVDGLLQRLMSTRDAVGIVNAENELLDGIKEYRTVVPAGRSKEVLIKMLFTQASIAQKEGTRLLLQEYNSLASQAFFKKSRSNLDGVRDLAEGFDTVLRQANEYERQGRGMSLFGEGFLLQERGAHIEAVERLRQAAAELEQLNMPVDLAFARWAKAAMHSNAAMHSELRGDYATSVKEYREASQAYRVAAERFPNTDQVYYTNAARMLFYADASDDRANAALARSNDIQIKTEKGRRSAGLIFFALWIVSGGGAFAAIKLLTLSVAGFEFITILAITFVGSMVAAALIKPAEAMHFLGNLGIGRAAKDPEQKS
jgi:hypothetical protein